MIHIKPSRRLGAALLVGVTGGSFLALMQTPWERNELAAGSRPRSQAAAPAQALNPRDFGVGPGALHDAVAQSPAMRLGALGAASDVGGLPNVAGVVIGAKDAAPGKAADAAAGEISGMSKDKARAGKGGKTKAGDADAPGGPDAKHKGHKGEKGDGTDSAGVKSSGGKAHGAAAGRASKSAGAQARAKRTSGTSGSSKRGKGAVARFGDGPVGKRKGSGRTTGISGGAGASGRSGRSGEGFAAGGKKGRGHHGGGGSGDGDDPFASGNSKVKVGKDGGGAGGALKSRSTHKKSGAHGGKGGSKDADGDDEDAAGGKHGGKKGGDKSGKSHGGAHHGGGHKPKDPNAPKDPSDHKKGTHPILSGDLEGEKKPTPPAKVATPPDFGGLDKSVPAKDDHGATITPQPAGYKDIEAVKAHKLPLGDPDKFGWKTVGDAPYYCKGAVCGRWSDDHWVWMQNKDGKWWIQSYSPRPDGTMGSDSPAYEQHQGHWWWQDPQSGSWYVVHDGQPWAHRYISRYKQDGLVNPQTGTQMVHTPDGNVLIVTPGKGADVYDGKTGELKEHRNEDQLPPADQKPPDVHIPVE